MSGVVSIDFPRPILAERRYFVQTFADYGVNEHGNFECLIKKIGHTVNRRIVAESVHRPIGSPRDDRLDLGNCGGGYRSFLPISLPPIF